MLKLNLNTWFFLCFIVVASCLLTSCKKTINNYYFPGPQNTPPVIVSYGPQLPPDSTEAYGFKLFVFVADSNGLEDISSVFLKIDSMVIYGIITRPDISSDSQWLCPHAPSYTDTVDVSQLVPRVVQGITRPFYSTSGSHYESIDFRWPVLDLDAASDYLSVTWVCSQSSVQYFGVYFVTPPGSTTSERIFLTYLDVKYFGISATVYDQSGLSDSVNFGDLRFIYTTVDEKSYPP